MQQRALGLCLLSASLFLIGIRSASAQEPVTFGLSYDLFYREFEETSAAGVHIDVAKPFGMLAGVGEIGFNHFGGATVSSFMGGGRLVFPHGTSSKIEPAVQVLLGAWRCCEERDFAIQPGFIVDFPYSMNLKIRGQIDLRHIFFSDYQDENAVRLSAGVVLNLGK